MRLHSKRITRHNQIGGAGNDVIKTALINDLTVATAAITTAAITTGTVTTLLGTTAGIDTVNVSKAISVTSALTVAGRGRFTTRLESPLTPYCDISSVAVAKGSIVVSGAYIFAGVSGAAAGQVCWKSAALA